METESGFNPDQRVVKLSDESWEQMNELEFHELFHETPLQRTSFKGIKRNIQFLSLKD